MFLHGFILKQFDREAANMRFHLEAMGKSAHAIGGLHPGLFNALYRSSLGTGI